MRRAIWSSLLEGRGVMSWGDSLSPLHASCSDPLQAVSALWTFGRPRTTTGGVGGAGSRPERERAAPRDRPLSGTAASVRLLLLQEGQDRRRGLVGLGEHRLAGLSEDRVLRVLHHLRRHVDVADPALGG